MVGLDSACNSMAFIFHVAFDLGGITCEGSTYSLLVSQLPRGVTNLNVVGLFVLLDFGFFYCTVAYGFELRGLEC